MTSENEIPFSKILKPTAEEFADFARFVENLDHDKTSQNYGVVKVIPPAKWKARKGPIDFNDFVVHSPIEQNIQGKSGIYELLLIQKKSMKLNDYKKKVESFDAITNDKSVEEVEDFFWKNLTFSPPLYGSDMAGTLFEDGVAWDLKDLPGVLKEGLKSPISGVNNPYLYVGSWKTMFCWHKEDLDLYSINYLHHGKPKFWYTIPPSEGEKLEKFARNYFHEGFSKCKELLRHKTIMINPYLLKQKIPDLKIHKMIQNPGEFVITFGGAYHAGFNWGFNIAEAVNFATPRWLEIFTGVNACKCINDSVKIGRPDFYANILNSPIYGKMPNVRKVCIENGATKSKFHLSKGDQDEVESTEAADSHENSPKKSRSKSTKKGKTEASKKAKIVNKPTRNANSKRTKTVSKKNENKDEDLEEKPAQRISSRSKKIKKLGEEYDTSDWKKGQPLRQTLNVNIKKITAPQKNNKGQMKKGNGAGNYSTIPLENEN